MFVLFIVSVFSMAPILYHDPVKTGSRALLLVVKELNLDVQCEDLDQYKNQELAKHSELVLTDNDVIVTNHHKAIKYLAEKFQNVHAAFPNNAATRKKIEEILNLDEDALQPPLKNALNSVLVLNEKEISIDKIRSLQKGYDQLEQLLQNTQFLSGDILTVADLCCLATISSATIFTPVSSAKYPKLFQWFAKCKQLPYYKEANSAGLTKLDLLVEENLGCVNRT